jgi:hypothetical protein
VKWQDIATAAPSFEIPKDTVLRDGADRELQKSGSNPTIESVSSGPDFQPALNSDHVYGASVESIPTSQTGVATAQDFNSPLTPVLPPQTPSAYSNLAKRIGESPMVMGNGRVKVWDRSLRVEERIPHPLSPQSTSSDGLSIQEMHQKTSSIRGDSTDNRNTTSQSATPSPSPSNDATAPAHPEQQASATVSSDNSSVAPSTMVPGAQIEALGSPHVSRQGQSMNSSGAPNASPEPLPLPIFGQVNIARIVSGLSQSEMHIGLRTQAFGTVEVHTTVRDSQIGLTLGSEKGDLRNVLAPEIGSMQSSLRQQDLHLESIRFLENSAGTSFGSPAQHQGHSGESRSQPGNGVNNFAGADRHEDQNKELSTAENVSLSVLV